MIQTNFGEKYQTVAKSQKMAGKSGARSAPLSGWGHFMDVVQCIVLSSETGPDSFLYPVEGQNTPNIRQNTPKIRRKYAKNTQKYIKHAKKMVFGALTIRFAAKTCREGHYMSLSLYVFVSSTGAWRVPVGFWSPYWTFTSSCPNFQWTSLIHIKSPVIHPSPNM